MSAARGELALWPVPLIAGMLPAVGAIAALFVSMRLELIPSCNPLLEGCVSVSRAGRHGLANILFRSALLPAAALQSLTWVLCSRWLRCADGSAHTAVRARWMQWLGIVAGVFLVLYGSFLGTEGAAYRWLRIYGTVVYFGFTFLCMLLLASVLRHDASPPGSPLRRLGTAVISLCWLLLALGVGNTLLGPLFDAEAKDRIENVTEWWAACAFTLVFLLLAAIWRSQHVVARLEMR